MHERKTRVEFNPDIAKLTRKKRACAYARVSSEKDEAFHSLSAQISYYQKKIAEHPDWEFVEVFADRGITGTKENREGFQRMLTACREHKVDIVLAKSITRFARNTVILLQTVRELKELGIDIHFEEEHIETLSEKGEFMISILAARAQEESRSVSENQKWRIRKSYEKGIPVTGNCLGYRMVDHQFLIEEEEEQIVLKIFSMYLSGMGKTAIAKKLNEEGVKTRLNKGKWNPNSIYAIIRNEKYIGDLFLQKEYVADHITKKCVHNHGEKPKYLVRDVHDPIIDRETFRSVEIEIARRKERYKPKEKQDCKKHYPFTGFIECGKCSSHYRRKMAKAGTKYEKPVWICNTFNVYGKNECDSQQIPEDILIQKTCEALSIKKVEEVDLHDYLQKIVIPEAGKITFVLLDGTEKTIEWEHHSRSRTWTPEMREQARKYANKRWRKEKGNGS